MMSKLERKRNIIGAVLLVVLIMFMGVVIFQNWQASMERDEAQSSAATSAQQKKNLAEEVADACQSGQVIKSVAGVDLCARAESIAQQPVAVEGPQGPAGPRGLPGADGQDGKDGATGALGKTGAAGTNGVDGLTGMSGTAGLNGAAGPPGPEGPAGTDGAPGTPGKDGADSSVPGPQGPAGSSVESFRFTDHDGVTYSCTPDPPGSLTYTCTTPKP